MNTQTTLNLIDDEKVLEAFLTLEEYSGEEMFTARTDEGNYTFWAQDNSFPLSVLNEGTPGVETWEGVPAVVNIIHQLIDSGYTVKLVCREDGDETDYQAGSEQDYKLTIS